MAGSEAFLEIWSTLLRHKLRAALTGLSVAWGVFVLILLLGAGNGLEKGALATFERDALNAVYVIPGTTSLPFGGQGPGRKVKLTNPDYETARTLDPAIQQPSGSFNLRGQFSVRYGARRANFGVRGVRPAVQYVEKTLLRSGRFLNDADLAERRKVAVIGVQVADFFFKQRPALGEYIQIKGVNYRVIGVHDDPNEEDTQRNIFVPISTLQLLSSSSSEINDLMFLLDAPDLDKNHAVVERLSAAIAEEHNFSVKDPRALRVFNNPEYLSRVANLFRWIRVFVWLVGVGTLFAGIVGVSNIMLISVRERTQEIGLRKALGATPGSIIRMIVGEALLVTGLAGYAGLSAGISCLALAARFLPKARYLGEPEVDFGVALSATLLIILAGTLAGFFPARQAARVNPITALRAE